MTTKRATLTWPDLLNELYGNGIFQQLPSQSGILLHAILYRFNQYWFKNWLEIPNGDLQTLSKLTSKQFYKARTILLEQVNTKIRDEYEFKAEEPDFLVYISSGSSNYSGKYYLNAMPIIRRLASERQVNHRRQAGDTQVTTGGPIGESNAISSTYQSPELIQKGGHNNTIQENQNQTISNRTYNNNTDDVIVCSDLNMLGEDVSELLHQEIIDKLSKMGMTEYSINKVIETYTWDQIVVAYNAINGKYGINNYVSYFVGTLKNVAKDSMMT